MNRVTQGSVARSRRTPRMLILPVLFEPFDHGSPENRIFQRYAHLMVSGTFFPH
jgi:hypothetical protein